MKAKIAGTGSYLPSKILSNAELEKMVETSDEWIVQRVGIFSRHIASLPHETNVFMASEAAKKALEMSGVLPQDLDLIIIATSTPDDAMPSTAVSVQALLGNTKAMCFDMSAACSGFIYGLSVIKQFFATGASKKALLIGSERMSRVIDWTDRSTCVLFGDGAGACVFTADENFGILSTQNHSDGRERDALYIKGHLNSETPEFIKQAACSLPNTLQSCLDLEKDVYLHMEGSRVFKSAVNMLGEVALGVLAQENLLPEDLDWLVPHQANLRIIMATAKKLNLPEEKIIITLTHQGNTSAASVPMALDHAVRAGKIKSGDLLLLEAFGSGFVWGAALVRY